MGRQSDPAVQEKALTGNTISFAPPTADIPSMELPPPPDALVDCFNIIFTRSVHDLPTPFSKKIAMRCPGRQRRLKGTYGQPGAVLLSLHLPSALFSFRSRGAPQTGVMRPAKH